MRLAEDQKIVNFTRISNDEDTNNADSDNAEPEVTETVDKPNMPMLSDEADVEPDPAE